MVSGQKQTSWKLPAVLNLTLGGMGAGFYLISLLTIFSQGADGTQTLVQTAVFKLLGPFLVSVGLISLTTEAGHPLKSIYLLINLRHSWMSREALAGGIFILAAGLDWLLPGLILKIIAASAALVFILAQGMIVWRASGVLTWNTPAVPWFFLTCGLATGCGLMLVVNSFLNQPSWVSLPLVMVVIAIANLVVWVVYLNTPGDVFQRGIAPLHTKGHLALSLGLGHALPIALLILTLITPLPFVVPVAGLTMVFGGVIQKFSFTFEGSTMRSVIRTR